MGGGYDAITRAGSKVTEKITCAMCGMLLYFGEEIRRRLYMRAIPSEETVFGFYDGTCPRCSSPLSTDSVVIEVKRRRTRES